MKNVAYTHFIGNQECLENITPALVEAILKHGDVICAESDPNRANTKNWTLINKVEMLILLNKKIPVYKLKYDKGRAVGWQEIKL